MKSDPHGRCGWSVELHHSFYEGKVIHKRMSPKPYNLEMPARMALINIDDSPYWFKSQQSDHLTRDEACAIAGTSGSVHLLTTPLCFGCLMNPISVYFCFDGKANDDSDAAPSSDSAGEAVRFRCIAEVTNTPWGERVVFAFDPAGEEVPKALHVSPFMAIEDHSWIIKAVLKEDYVMVRERRSDVANLQTMGEKWEESLA